MGTPYAAPPDRAVGHDAGSGALTLYEADDALSERLGEIILMVRHIRHALNQAHGPWSPLHPQLDELEDALIDLEVDADHVQIRLLPSEGRGR